MSLIKKKINHWLNDKNWDGAYMYYLTFYSDYINKTYKNVCAYESYVIWGFNEGLYTYGRVKAIKYSENNSKRELLVNTIKNCKKRFVIIPIAIMQAMGVNMVAHFNMIIYDTKLNEVELFDSMGKTHEFQNHPMYNKYIYDIKEFFNGVIGSKYKFFEPVSFFPKGKEFQYLEINLCKSENFNINSNAGFCVIWGMWYAEERLKNENISRKKLVATFLKKFEKTVNIIKTSKDPEAVEKYIQSLPICNVVRNYTQFVWNLTKSKTFLERLNIKLNVHSALYIRQFAAIMINILVIFMFN